PVDGFVKNDIKIQGDYLSVSPYAVKQNIDIYFNNKRSYSEIDTENIGTVVMAEIGATMVGSIIQTFKENSPIKKGEEKGYFEFGGSTVILFFEKDKISIDEDILENSKKGLETQVFMGEKIAASK
nr:phosphatidylserine decarboxylase [Leptotrichiaceae bacterium]